MKKWIGTIVPFTTVFVLTSFGTLGFLGRETEVPKMFKTSTENEFLVKTEKLAASEPHDLVSLTSGYVGFKEALAFKESQGKYDTINSLGYLGKYQFGESTLKMVGIYNTEDFLHSPKIQEKAFQLNVARNKWILRRYIKMFSGKVIDGTEITESGLVAAAHLAGAGNVKKYLRSYGREDFSDAFGSSVKHYIRKFGGYDLTAIPQKHNPKI